MGFNAADYETVEARLTRFWDEHPTGRIWTDLIAYSDSQYIIKAAVFSHADDAQPIATGFAEEKVAAKGVNATSALENCETSAIGRALANAGYAPKGKRPSREEMEKANRPAPPALDDAEIVHLASIVAAVPLMDLEGLREAWKANAAHLEVPIGDTTLLAAISARRAELEEEAAPDEPA